MVVSEYKSEFQFRKSRNVKFAQWHLYLHDLVQNRLYCIFHVKMLYENRSLAENACIEGASADLSYIS